MLIAVHLADGLVQSVSTDDGGNHRAILVGPDDVAIQYVPTNYDAEIRRYCAGAREQGQIYGIGLACEIASEGLLEVSRMVFTTPLEMLTAIRGISQALSGSLQKAMAS